MPAEEHGDVHAAVERPIPALSCGRRETSVRRQCVRVQPTKDRDALFVRPIDRHDVRFSLRAIQPSMSFAGRDFHAPNTPLTTGRAISTVSLRGLRRPRGRAQVHRVPIMESSARTVSRQGTHHGLRRFPTAGRFPWLAFLFRRPRFWSARLDIATSPWLQSSTDLRRSVVSFSKRSRARALSTSAAALAGLRLS